MPLTAAAGAATPDIAEATSCTTRSVFVAGSGNPALVNTPFNAWLGICNTCLPAIILIRLFKASPAIIGNPAAPVAAARAVSPNWRGISLTPASTSCAIVLFASFLGRASPLRKEATRSFNSLELGSTVSGILSIVIPSSVVMEYGILVCNLNVSAWQFSWCA